jgi:hypothetical protein
MDGSRRIPRAEWGTDLSILCQFLFPRFGNLRLYPAASHAVIRDNQQQSFVYTDRFVDLFVDLLPALNVVGSKPTPHTLVLQVGIDALCEGLVFARIANEGF